MNAEQIAGALREHTSATVVENRTLGPLTTYRVGGPALVFVEIDGEADAAAVARVLGGLEERPPVLVLGRGSNVVVSDHGFDGVVVKLGPGLAGVDPLEETDARAGAALPLPMLANWAARRSLAGAEFCVSIPGTVGGGVRMNAGAHGAEMSDIVVAATVLSFASAEVGEMTQADLGSAYRRSNLTDEDLVLRAHLRFTPEPAEAIRARMEEYRAHRAATQPGALQNAGSTFKNPPGDAAGRLVEAAGLKGFRVGGAEVSTLHANFFIARTGATSQDVFDLIQEVRRRVHEASGVWLEPEVRFVGRFDERAVRT